MGIKKSGYNKSIVSKVNKSDAHEDSKGCLFCGDICPCEISNYYDAQRSVDSNSFVEEKLICLRHNRKISNVFKKADPPLMCGLSYYKDLIYGVELLKQKSRVLECRHVTEGDLLRKRLDIIYQDYDNTCLLREDKTK